jgi:hypothetical protein
MYLLPLLDQSGLDKAIIPTPIKKYMHTFESLPHPNFHALPNSFAQQVAESDLPEFGFLKCS